MTFSSSLYRVSILAIALFVVLFPAIARAQAPAAVPVNAPQPKRITVAIKSGPLREAFASIRSQSGIQFSMTPTPGPLDEALVTLDVRDQPLLETVRALALQANPTHPERWYLSDPQSSGLFSIGGRLSISGPFVVAIKSITHRVDYSLPDDQVDTLQLECQIATDGSVRVPALVRQVMPTRALDDKGNSLLPTSSAPLDSRTMPSNPTATSISPLPFIMVLQPPAAVKSAGQKIATLEGAIPVTLQVTQTIEFAIPATGEQRVNGYTIAAEYSDTPAAAPPTGRGGTGRAPPGGPTVTLRITRDTNSQTPDLITTLRSVQVRLLDSSGNPFRVNGSSFQPNGSVRTGTFRFATVVAGQGGAGPTAAPAKIIVQIPADSQDILVPYHFENITLP